MGQGPDGEHGRGGERGALVGLGERSARRDETRGEEGHDPAAHAHELEGMGAVGRDEADRGAVLEHGPETGLFHACGSRFHAGSVKLGRGRHSRRQDEPADHSRG